MMNTCKKYQQIMHRILDMEASEEERESVQQHMAVCRMCADTFSSLKVSLNLLVSMPSPSPSQDFTTKTVERALSADKIRARYRTYASWCFGILMVLISISLAAGWSAIIQSMAWLGLQGLLNVLLKGMVLCTVFDKLQTILVGLSSLMGDIAIKVVLGKGGPAFWGSLMMLFLAGVMLTRSDIRMPRVSIKRR